MEVMGHDTRDGQARVWSVRELSTSPRDTTLFSGIFPEIPEWSVRMATKKIEQAMGKISVRYFSCDHFPGK